MVRYFITKGVDVNLQDNNGNTPLHKAMDDINSNKAVRFWIYIDH